MIWFLIVIGALAVLALAAVLYWVVLTAKLKRPIKADEVFEVTTEDLWKIRLFRFRPEGKPGEPVLLCHSAMANHLNFTTPDSSNLVKTLTAQGYDCWVLEFRGSRSSTPPHGRSRSDVIFDDLVLRDLPAAIEAVCGETGYDAVHYVGHSMGGMALYAYAQTSAEPRIASAATLGSPPGFDPGHLKPPYLLLGFFKTFPLFTERFLRGLAPFLKRFRPSLRVVPINWSNVHPDFTSADFFHMIEATAPAVMTELAYYGESGTWLIDGNEIDVQAGLSRFSVPLFAIFAQRDPLIPVARARAFFDQLPGADKRMAVLSMEEGCSADYDHCDLAFGCEGDREVYQPIAEWFAAHPIGAAKHTESEQEEAAAGESKPKRAVRRRKPATVAAKKKTAAKKPRSKPCSAKKAESTVPDDEENVTPDVVTPEEVTPEPAEAEVVEPGEVVEPAKPKKKGAAKRKPAAKKKASSTPRKAAPKKRAAKKKAPEADASPDTADEVVPDLLSASAEEPRRDQPQTEG